MVGDSAAIERQLSAASAINTRLVDVSHDVRDHLVHDIPELDGDNAVVGLLAAIVESNVATLLHILEHGIVPDTIDAPVAALEYARRLAQRDVPL
jgi:hypothetical protein